MNETESVAGKWGLMRRFATAALPVMTVVVLLVLGTATVSMAGVQGYPVPELDPTTGAAAVALIAGAVVIIRARMKKNEN